MKGNKGLTLIVIFALLALLGNTINRYRDNNDSKPVEKVESIDPYSMDYGDDLLIRIEMLDERAKEIDPNMTLVTIEWREGDSTYALLFRSKNADIVWYIAVD